MYSIALPNSTKPFTPIVVADYGPTRPFAQNGFRIVPVLTPGTTYAEAMAGLQVTYIFTSSQDPVDNPNLPHGAVTLDVTDSSTYKLSNGGGLTIVAGRSNQQWVVSIIEEGDEDIEPDSGPGSASGGNAANVATTFLLTVNGYVPTTSPTDGVPMDDATGGLIFFSTVGTWVDGQPILAYAAVAIGAGTGWVRAFENDQAVPIGAAAEGANSNGFVLPDMSFTVGATGRRLMYVPAAAAVDGDAYSTVIYQIQS